MTRLMILLAGLTGSVVILRTAQFYRGVDSFAFTVVCFMGAALLAGIVELFVTERRNRGLHAELGRITKEPSLEGIEQSKPLLRALLRARLDRVPLGVPRASFTPYLVGLLVMLGLLGTFLGLFETLRGAREVLTTSGDVEALRAGLSTPMGGLMRSFGTSAAGVCASAMLGLAAVFCRRAGSQFGVALHAAASGPFARFAAAHRQLVALEQLAKQGEALPAAAEALSAAATRIDTLRSEWAQSHHAATSDISTKLTEATAEVTRVVSGGIQEAAAASKAAVAPLLTEAVAGTVAAAAEHFAQVETLAQQGQAQREAADKAAAAAQAELLGTVTERISAAENARLDAETTRLGAQRQQYESLLARLDGLEEERRQQHRALASEIAQQGEAVAEERRASLALVLQRHEALSSDVQRQGEAFVEERRASLAALLEAQAEAQRGAVAREDARLQAVEARLESAVRTLSEAQAATTADLVSQVHALHQTVSQNIDAASERDVTRAEALSSAATTLREELTEAANVMRDRLTVSAEADAQRAEQAQQLFQALEGASGRIGDAAGTQAQALEQFVASMEGRTEALEQRSQARLDALLTKVGEAVEAQATGLAALEEQLTSRMAELEQQLGHRQKQSAEALAATLSDHATGLGEGLEKTALVVQDAAGLVHAGGAELTAVAEMFAAAVDRQRHAAREWLANLGHVERAIADVGEGAAADALGQHLARTHEIFDRQLRFQQELFEQLRSREAHGATVNGHVDVSA